MHCNECNTSIKHKASLVFLVVINTARVSHDKLLVGPRTIISTKEMCAVVSVPWVTNTDKDALHEG